MTIEIGSITQTLLTKALDVSLQTQQVIANNVANVNTEGYRALKLDFAQVMQGIADDVHNNTLDEQHKTQITAMNGFDHIKYAAQEQVQLETEMVAMAENTLRYQALVDAKKSLGSLMAMAINVGKV